MECQALDFSEPGSIIYRQSIWGGNNEEYWKHKRY